MTKEELLVEAVARTLCKSLMGPPDYVVPKEHNPLWIRFIPHAYEAIQTYKEFTNVRTPKSTRGH
jgi:hypothetical protein